MKPRHREKSVNGFVAPRVRYEPATIEEAVHAARGLTCDVSHQVEIAAGLIGVDHDEVRPHVLRLQQRLAVRTSLGDSAPRVVVERRRLMPRQR